MSNNEFYRRQDRMVPEPATPQPHTEDTVTALTVHRDPSVSAKASNDDAKTQRPGIAWVRPSELPTLVASPLVRGGIDLQSGLVRRSRRAPIKAARAGRRVSRMSIAHPEPATPSVTPIEELGL